MTAVFATGADAAYGCQLLNLLGSLTANSPGMFGRVVAWDLGLSEQQRRLLGAVRGVETRAVPPFVEHWARGFTWKPWIWTHVAGEGDDVLWVDAGATVLRPLAAAVERIRETGGLLVSQGGMLREIVPRDEYGFYGLDPAVDAHPYAAAGVIGFRVGGELYDRVIVPAYEDCLAGRSLGFSPGEERTLGRGLNASEAAPVRACPHFRWDQSVLNARLFAAFPDTHLEELERYAGWRSPHDHPDQLVWHHRKRGPLTYLPRVPYTPALAREGRAFGQRQRLRWWLKLNERYVRSETYRLKLRRVFRTLARARA